MRSIARIIITLLVIVLPSHSFACDAHTRVEKKPNGLRKTNPDKGNPYLTAQDRLLWRSVLQWCEECEDRSGILASDEEDGRMYVDPVSDGEYIVTVGCQRSAYQTEYLFYKVSEKGDTIESRLLSFEQYYFQEDKHDVKRVIAERSKKGPHAELKQQGEFIKFTDSLVHGETRVDKNRKHLAIEHRFVGVGGCGLLTVYDVSGDCPKVVEFRAKTYCSANYVPPEKWKLYPPKARAKWRTTSSPLREDWKDKDQCR